MATVGEIMSGNLLTVAPDTPIGDVVRLMHEREVGAVLVLDGERLVGIFTERDVLHAAATGRLEGKVEDLMSRHPETIEASDSTGHAVSADISGLTPGATYHYRLVATNASGTTAGDDRTFTATPAPTSRYRDAMYSSSASSRPCAR